MKLSLIIMEINAIYEGDNLEIMSKFPSKSIDLIYADPPFFSNRKYEVIWKDKAEISSFEDRWEGGIEHYISWMEPRLRECHRLLKDTGSMYLHCDWHASAHLKVLMDRIFNDSNFRNEIVWPRTYAHSDSKQGAKAFGRIHDTILFYSKSVNNTWNTQYRPYEQDYIEKTFKQRDEEGRRYQTVTLTASKPGGDTEFEWHGIRPPNGRYWAYSKANLDKMEKEGKIVFLKSGIPRLKKYVDDTPGVPIQDVWSDITRMSTFSNERTGYPTQKPVALLERIVSASSNKGDIVFDPFCGCGTTIIASQKLGRKWIGIDISPTACNLMQKRLRKEFTMNAQIIRGAVDIKYVKKLPPFEFQNWVVTNKFFGTVSKTKSGDFGIDGLTPQVTGGYPIQVKQSEDIGRNVIDNFETAIRRMNKKKGYVVAFSFGRGAVEEVARVKNQEGIEIILRTVQDLLDGKIE